MAGESERGRFGEGRTTPCGFTRQRRARPTLQERVIEGFCCRGACAKRRRRDLNPLNDLRFTKAQLQQRHQGERGKGCSRGRSRANRDGAPCAKPRSRSCPLRHPKNQKIFPCNFRARDYSAPNENGKAERVCTRVTPRVTSARKKHQVK